MAVPNFLCVGVQKAGTTTLYEILKRHPDVFLPQKVKETKFFVFEERYAKGLQWYEKKYFSEWNGQQAIGEIEPAIIFEEEAARRIYDSLGGDVKLMFIFRNPVARAYSHYLMSRRKGFEDLSFDEAIEKEAERLKADPEKRFNFSYLSRGRYAQQLERFLKLFKRQNMMFIVFEDDFIRNRKKTFDRIQDFLGVKHAELDLDIRINEAAEPKNKAVHVITRKPSALRTMLGALLPRNARRTIQKLIGRFNSVSIETPKLDDRRTKELISKYFMDDIHQLEKLTGRDLSTWYN